MQKGFLTDIKKTWGALLLFYLISALIVPPAYSHSHSHSHADSRSHQTITPTTASAHAHPGNLLSGDLLTHDDDFTHLLGHSKDNNQHSHSFKKVSQISNRRSISTEKQTSLLLHIVCNKVVFQKVSFRIFNQIRPPIHNYNLEFIIVATNLPPPTV